MALPLITRRRQVMVVLETVSGTAESVPEEIESFDAYDLSVTHAVNVSRFDGDGLHGSARIVSGRRNKVVEFTTYLFGAAGAAMYEAFLPPCRWTNGGEGNVWSPFPEEDEGDVPTATIFVWEDGRLRKIAGAAGTFVVQANAGEPPTIRWRFEGADAGMSAATMPAITRELAGVAAARYLGGTQTVLSQTPVVASFNFDAGSVLATRDSAASSYGGVLGYRVVGHQPTLDIVAEDQLSGWLPESALDSNTPGGFSLAGAGFTLAATSAGVSSVTPTDRNGLMASTVRLEPVRMAEETPLVTLTLS